jgi:hypothetical protein
VSEERSDTSALYSRSDCPTQAPESHKVVARGITHSIDAEYGIAAGLVACADYSGSLATDQLLMRLGKYDRQSDVSRVTSRSFTARGPVVSLAWSRLGYLALNPSDLEDGPRDENFTIT